MLLASTLFFHLGIVTRPRSSLRRWLGVLGLALDPDQGVVQVLWSHTGLCMTIGVHTSQSKAPAFCADCKDKDKGGVSVSTEGVNMPYKAAGS